MVSLLPNPAPPSDPSAHMVVCGDDGLAHRLAAELRSVYREQVVLVVPPSARVPPQPMAGRARAASAALFGRMVTAVNRDAGGSDDTLVPGERVMEAADPTEAVLADAGVDRAAALALVYDDDETNIRAALTARRLNPRLRLVLRLYNRRLGQHIEELLDQAAGAVPHPSAPTAPTSHHRLSDAGARALRHFGRCRAAKSSSRRICLIRSSTTSEPWPAS
ncbi:hypothetical protein SALBM217S_08311 [Streptomyces griseoloalbus]